MLLGQNFKTSSVRDSKSKKVWNCVADFFIGIILNSKLNTLKTS